MKQNKPKQLVSISNAAHQLGVCIDTLREWDKAGILKPLTTVGKHRRYKQSDIDKMKGEVTQPTFAELQTLWEHIDKMKGEVAIHPLCSEVETVDVLDRAERLVKVVTALRELGLHDVEAVLVKTMVLPPMRLAITPTP